ncbi:MAG TPA: hypothetical protein VK138_12770 [Acidiferrobacterales bacterium]|nr:hypothetical protein [Acidiferrobacterales bacterium]
MKKNSLRLRLSLFVTATFLLGACSDQKSNDHVWKEQVKTLGRAKGVEKTLSDRALETDKNIEKQEGGTSGSD